MKITAPGVYSMPSSEYHGDCCDGPSLSSTGARLLATKCPAAFKWSKENPQVKDEFDIGNSTHLLVLEPELFDRTVIKLPFDNWKTKESQQARDEVRANGRIPLIRPQLDQVEGMRASLFVDPVARFAFQNSEVERSMFWRDPEHNHWLKCRPDALPKSLNYAVDLKTSVSADPRDFQRDVWNYGYFAQASWYLDGIERVMGQRPPKFYFVVVSKAPPYLVTTCLLDDEAIGWGSIANRYARGIFAWCLEHDSWPSFTPDITQPPAAFTVGLPFWAKRELERRHEAGEFTIPQERVAA